MAIVKTQNGRAITANRMKGTTPSQAEPLYIGVGTSGSAATAADTVVTSEVGTTRVTGTSSIVTTTTTNDTYRVVGTYTNSSGGSQTITQGATCDTNVVGSTGLNVKGDFSSSAILANGDSLIVTVDEKFA